MSFAARAATFGTSDKHLLVSLSDVGMETLPWRVDAAKRTGKALFAWTKDMEQRHEVGLLKYLNGWAKLQEFPSRMVDWDGEQVSLAYQEAIRKIQSIQPSRAEAYEEALAN